MTLLSAPGNHSEVAEEAEPQGNEAAGTLIHGLECQEKASVLFPPALPGLRLLGLVWFTSSGLLDLRAS